MKPNAPECNWPRISTYTRFSPFVITIASFLVIALAFNPAHADPVTETFSVHSTDSEQAIDHTTWDALLAKYVVPGSDGLNRVKYQKFKSNDHDKLKAYIAELSAVDPRQLNKNEQFAFWANLYNAKTVDIILDKYPVASIRDISLEGGIFDLIKKKRWRRRSLENESPQSRRSRAQPR